MKTILTPKWVSIILVILIFIGLSIESIQDTTWVIASLFIAFWLAISIHELGHVVFGKLSGFDFYFFTTGPFQFEKTVNGIKIRENKYWLFFGGVAMMTPPKEKKEVIIKKTALYTAGGPILSVLVGCVSFILYQQFSFMFLMFFAVMNGAILIATIIPLKNSMRTDGYVLLALLKNNEESLTIVEDLLVSKELLGRKQPGEWNHEYIKLAKQKKPSIDNLQYAMLIYYFEIEQNGLQAAIESLESYSRISVTKNNKFQLGFLIHMEQLSHFLTGDVQSEKIVRLQQLLSRIEPVSFYRGLAMITYLQNDKLAALENIKKVKKIIEQNEEIYGFYKAEKTLTKLVEEKIMI